MHHPVTGLDGKSYTAPDKPKPKRKPIKDSAESVAWEIAVLLSGWKSFVRLGVAR